MSSTINAQVLDLLINEVAKVAGLSAPLLEKLARTITEAVSPVVEAQLASEKRWILGMAKLVDEIVGATSLSRAEALQLVSSLASQTPSHFEGGLEMMLRMVMERAASGAAGAPTMACERDLD